MLLNIDTATDTASVCVSREGNAVALATNNNQKEHASFVHQAIEQVLNDANCSLYDLDGFAVTAGPGSYTGLRVGMSAAKGFCYALSKPLLTENTLRVMAKAALNSLAENEKDVLLCPMIDARRMDVFTAVYDCSLNCILAPAPVTLSADLLNDLLESKKIIFFGNGSGKFGEIERNKNSLFKQIKFDASHLGNLADEKCKNQQFSDVALSEPDYLKAFYSTKN